MTQRDEFDLSGLLPIDVGGGESQGAATAVAAPAAVVPAAPPAPKRGRPPKGSKLPLYFDLETVPDESRLELFGLEPLPQLPPETPAENLLTSDQFLSQSLDEIRGWLAKHNPPAKWLEEIEAAENGAKKPRKGLIEAIKECRDQYLKIASAGEERRKLLSITPEYCRIAAIGYGHGSDPAFSMVVGRDSEGTENTEADLISDLWTAIGQSGTLIGFNILGFDLLVLLARSALLGIKATRRIDLKPWGNDCIDLMATRFARGPAMKLKDLARLYGIPVPAGDTDGTDVQRLLKEDPQKLGEYVRSDVEISKALHAKWSGLFCN